MKMEALFQCIHSNDIIFTAINSNITEIDGSVLRLRGSAYIIRVPATWRNSPNGFVGCRDTGKPQYLNGYITGSGSWQQQCCQDRPAAWGLEGVLVADSLLRLVRLD